MAKSMVMCAGALHFLQLPAMWLFRTRVLRLGPEVSLLQPATQRIVMVLGLAVVLTVQGLGLAVVVGSADLVGGSTLARCLLGFLAVFWAFRAGCQWWYRPVWPTAGGGTAVHRTLLALFVLQASLYLAVLTQV